jgi:hypothetical protein
VKTANLSQSERRFGEAVRFGNSTEGVIYPLGQPLNETSQEPTGFGMQPALESVELRANVEPTWVARIATQRFGRMSGCTTIKSARPRRIPLSSVLIILTGGTRDS